MPTRKSTTSAKGKTTSARKSTAGARARTAAARKIADARTKGLEDLFHDGLKDIYYAERKIITALRKMAKAAESEAVTAAFEKHRAETEGQVERLQQVFEILGKKPQGKTCPGINGILEEGEEILGEFKKAPALDAGLVAAAQAVEHYEISRYGALASWAGLLGLRDAVSLLQQSLDEEKNTDAALTRLGETGVNERAMQEAA
jgi:ferritin-like metal-binding protein YciE